MSAANQFFWKPIGGASLPQEGTDATTQLLDVVAEHLICDPHPLTLESSASAVAWASLLQGFKSRSSLQFCTEAKLRSHTEKLFEYVRKADLDSIARSDDLLVKLRELKPVTQRAEAAALLSDDRAPRVPLLALFRYATACERFCVILGLLSAVVQGGGLPAFSFIFGSMINEMMTPEVPLMAGGGGAPLTAPDGIPVSRTVVPTSSPDAPATTPMRAATRTLVAMLTPTPAPVPVVVDAVSNISVTPLVVGDASTPTPYAFMVDQIDRLSIAMLIVGGVALVSGFFQIVLLAAPARLNISRIRSAAMMAVMQHEIGWFDRPHHAPMEVALRIQSDANKVHNAIGEKLSTSVMSLSTFVVAIVVAMVLSWRVTLIILAASPLLLVGGVAITVASSRGAAMSRDAYAQAGAWATDCLLGHRTVSALTAETEVESRYDELVARGKNFVATKSVLMGFGFAFLYGSFTACYAWATWWSSAWVESGLTDAGTVLAVFFCVIIGVMSLGQFGTGLSDLRTGMSAAFRLFAVIDRERSIAHTNSPPGSRRPSVAGGVGSSSHLTSRGGGKPGASPFNVAKGSPLVEFQNVSFAYGGAAASTPVLQKVNVVVNAGEKVAFVGHTGCGKSTALALISRLYDPTGGVVKLGGVPLQQLDVGVVRGGMSVVSQDPGLFNGTVRENLLLASPQASEAELQEVLAATGVLERIRRLPHGLDTSVGDGGAMLSGGQRQLISLARALLRKPKLLLLDEATSALDRTTELSVSNAFAKLGTEITVVSVAHRLVTIKEYDRIYVMSPDTHGVIESGTHDQLVSKKGVYYTMAAAQGLVKSVGGAKNGPRGQGGVVVDDDDDAGLESEIVREMSPCGGAEGAGSAVGKLGGKGTLVKEGKSEEDAAQEEAEEKAGTFGSVARIGLRWWPLMLLGCLGAAAAGMLYPLFALSFSKMMRALAPEVPNRREVTLDAVYFFLFLTALAFFGNLFQVGCTTYLGERITVVVRKAAFSSMMWAPKRIFDASSTSPSALAGLLVDSADAIQAVFGSQLAAYCRTMVGLIFGVAIAFYYCWQLALVLMLTVPIMGVVSAIQSQMFMSGTVSNSDEDEKSRKEKKAKGKKGGGLCGKKKAVNDDEEEEMEDEEPPTAAALAVDAIGNVRTAQLLQMEAALVDRFEKALQPEVRRAVRNSFCSGVAFGIAQFLGLVMFAFALWFGAKFLVPEYATFDDIFVSSMALVMSATGAGEATMFTSQVVDAKRAGGKLFPLMYRFLPNGPLSRQVFGADRVGPVGDENGVVDTHKGGVGAAGFNGSITLRNVSFSYPQRPDGKVLQNVSISIRAGQFTAIVGATGSGKSTVAQLIERFYSVSSGQILYGEAQQTVDSPAEVRALRRAIGYVPQEPCLFDASVVENVLLGAPPGSSRNSVIEACKAAQIHEQIMRLPAGYDTPVGPRGSRLSGGQRQRVAIARALVRNPQMLILDEATAALDAVSEAAVHAQVIDESRRKRNLAVLAIAHRLPAIRGADEVVVLEDGVVVEHGSLQSLVAADGAFAARWRAFEQHDST